MKSVKILLFLSFSLVFSFSSGQVVCVKCYDQNTQIVQQGTSNFIVNGSFENTTCNAFPGAWDIFCPTALGYNCDIQNWSCTGGGMNTYCHIYDTSSYVIIPDGLKAAYFGNGYANACSIIPEDMSCFIQSGCEVTNIPSGFPTTSDSLCGGTAGVSLEQTVTGLLPGSVYVLEFWAGGENAGTTPSNGEDGLFAVDVGFGKIFLRDPVTSSVSLLNTGRVFLVEFIATASSHTVRFTNWGHICQMYCTELLLDNVHLYHASQIPPSYICPTGIEEMEDLIVNFDPNPFSDYVKINMPENITGLLQLFDITGRCIMKSEITNNTQLNTAKFPSGMYSYSFISDSGIIKTGKVIKTENRKK